MDLRSVSPEQRDANRVRGIATRRKRASTLRRLRDGEVTIAQVREDDEAWASLRGMRVGLLIKAVPGWTDRRAFDLLTQVKVEPERVVRALGKNQLAAILEALAG